MIAQVHKLSLLNNKFNGFCPHPKVKLHGLDELEMGDHRSLPGGVQISRFELPLERIVHL